MVFVVSKSWTDFIVFARAWRYHDIPRAHSRRSKQRREVIKSNEVLQGTSTHKIHKYAYIFWQYSPNLILTGHGIKYLQNLASLEGKSAGNRIYAPQVILSKEKLPEYYFGKAENAGWLYCLTSKEIAASREQRVIVVIIHQIFSVARDWLAWNAVFPQRVHNYFCNFSVSGFSPRSM